jgi:hypothetical protein
MVVGLAPSSRPMLWLIRARRRPSSPTTRMTGLRPTPTPPSTAAFMTTPPWRRRSMAQNMIQGSEHRADRPRCAHEGRRRQETWAVLDCQWCNRLVHHSHSVSGESKEHGLESSHTTSARQLTASHTATRG